MIANYDVKMGTFISRGMLCNKSNYPTLVLTSTGGIILYLKIIGFPEIFGCFFVAVLFHTVAHSVFCAVDKQYRHFALLQSIYYRAFLGAYIDFLFA